METSNKRGASTFTIVSVITGVLILMIAVRWHAVNVVHTPHIPTPKMPSPNAFNYYVAAAGAIVDGDKIGYAVANVPETDTPSDPADPNRAYTLSEKETIVKNNTAALERLRQGFDYDYLNPPVRSYQGFPHLSGFREMSRLLCLEGQVRAGRGDWGGGMDSYLDALRLGDDTPRGGSLMHILVGIAIQSMGRHDAWKMIEKLDTTAARYAARRLETMKTRHISFADVMQEEKWITQAAVSHAMGQENLFKLMRGLGAELDWKTYPKMLIYSKDGMLRANARYMDALVAEARKPYAARQKLPEIPNDPLNQVLLPTFQVAAFTYTKNETQNVLLLVALALRAHKSEHGFYPNDLEELVPGYLQEPPDDPFALKGPLRYKRAGDDHVLYSVGPDGKDDGGKAVHDPSVHSNQHRVEMESKGDIVAGVNVY